MKRGFQLLTTRLPTENTDIDDLEKKYNFIFPPLLRVFLQTFSLDENVLFEERFKKDDGTLAYAAISAFDFKNNLIEEGTSSFSNFNNPESILNSKDAVEKWTENRYLPITDAFFGHGAIVVGTQKHDQDKVYLHYDDYYIDDSDEFTLIADNIFNFVKHLILKTEFYKDDVDHSKLYQNWNEDFWRLRSVNSSSK